MWYTIKTSNRMHITRIESSEGPTLAGVIAPLEKSAMESKSN